MKTVRSTTRGTQSIQAILAPYHRHKFRLGCGHHVTLGYFLGNNLIILNGKDLRVICTECGY